MGLNKLPAGDRFRIVLFNSNAYELTNGYLSASPDNIQRVMDQLANIQPDQGTNLYEVWTLACASSIATAPPGWCWSPTAWQT